jgi:hypothetical protein
MLRSEEPVRTYCPLPEEKVRALIGLGVEPGLVRTVRAVVGKDIIGFEGARATLCWFGRESCTDVEEVRSEAGLELVGLTCENWPNAEVALELGFRTIDKLRYLGDPLYTHNYIHSLYHTKTRQDGYCT